MPFLYPLHQMIPSRFVIVDFKMAGLHWTLNIGIAAIGMLDVAMLVHQIQIAMIVVLVLMTLYPLLYFVRLVKLTHLPPWIYIVV